MDFELTADQEALRSAAAELLADHASPAAVRAFVGEDNTAEPPPFDPGLWSAMAAQGWLGVEETSAAGGLGAGLVEIAVLCEQVGRHCAPAPFLSTVLALACLREAASQPGVSSATRSAAAHWAERLGSGEAVGCVAWAPDRPRGDGAGPEPVVDGPAADVAVVVGPGEVRMVVLDDASRPAREPAMDRTRPLGWLTATGDRIGDAAAAERACNRLATGLSAEMLGAAGRVLDMSVAYAKDRVQFGRPIGSFQAVKHRLANALVDVEGMRSTVYYAAWCVATGQPDASLAASMAKAWCSDASRRVMAAALQVHGGIGFTWEHGLHVFVKRAQLDQVSGGDAPWHRDRIATILAARLDAGEPVP